jgi:twinkle protein
MSGANIIRDEIDFGLYMQATDAGHKIIPASVYAEEVADYLENGEQLRGAKLPWKKTRDLIRFREGEVTLWSGMNGHGKSLALGQAMVGFVCQREPVCIASFEMKPVVTLARMMRQTAGCRQPDRELVLGAHELWSEWLWIYDQQGQVHADKILAVMRYAAEKLKVRHFVVDSLMKCGIAEDDFTAQKLFLDAITTIARDTGMHVHLVAHSRKAKDETLPPGKMDVKGSGSITDQVDNVVVVWRNKGKEQAMQAGGSHQPTEPDALLIIDKQRNGEFEGKVGLFFDKGSMQYLEHATQTPVDMLRAGFWE